MTEGSRPLFVARDTYRARRTMDAARLLPLLGVILWLGLLPLMRGNPTSGGSTSGSILFFFGVWIILIALAAVLARPLSRIERADAKADSSVHEE